MPQAAIHFLVIEKALKENRPSLWSEHYSFAALGSFAPDMFYAQDGIIGKDPFFYSLANKMHEAGALDCYCKLLNAVKKETDINARQSLKAFAYGYCAHMLTDIVFHPFVYRITGDHWHTHLPEANYESHKSVETFLDHYLLALETSSDIKKLSNHFTVCCKNNNILSAKIYDVLNKIINDIYAPLFAHDIAAKQAWHKYFEAIPICVPAHPIRQVVQIYCNSIGKLYKPEEKAPQIADIIREEWTNTEHRQWLPLGINSSLSYSAPELFNMAVKATKNAVEESEAFLNSEQTNSRIFFDLHRILYINEDHNLDTGLPSAGNEASENLSPDTAVRFAHGVEKLIANYELLR